MPPPNSRRLHPATLLLAAVGAIRPFVIPLIGVAIFGGAQAGVVVLSVFLVLAMVRAGMRYFSFSYHLDAAELVTTEGLLERAERHIPLARVQDVRLEQGLLHRLFGVVDVHVETAAGQGAEAALSVLSRAEAERLRAAVFARGAATVQLAEAGTGPPAGGRVIVRQVSVRELVLAGLTSNWLASVLALFAAAWAFLDDIFGEATVERLAGSIRTAAERLSEQGAPTETLVLVFVGLSVLVMIVGMLISTLITVALFHGFTLSLDGEDLHRAYGLLTRRASSLPRRRIQVLEIEERLLRRLFRLAALRADTAGSPAAEQGMARGGRDVLVPVMARNQVEALLPVFLPGWQPAADPWRRVSPLAIRRGTLKGSILCVGLAAAAVLYQRSWVGLWPLALAPLVYGVNVARYSNLGYLLNETHFCTRRGWLGRSTRIVPIRNVQAVVVERTPFDRRLGLASLVVDTAGQAYTGGGPRLANLPLAEAESLAKSLAYSAARLQYRW